jgi:lipopolysaccharide export system protein LptA
VKIIFTIPKLILFCYLFILLCLLDFKQVLAKNTQNQKSPEQPIIIRSDFITIKQKSQQVKFLQNVVVEQNDSSLFASEMVVDYIENASKKREINLITANKNVKLFNQNITATSDLGIYEPKKNLITLKNNVLVNDGKSIISGNKFIYDLITKTGKFSNQNSLIKSKKNTINQPIDNRVIVIIGDNPQESYQKQNE